MKLGILISPDKREVSLTKGEFDLLLVFARNLGRVVTRSELMETLSNREWSGTERSIDVLVGRLRQKLGDNPRQPRLLTTIHGSGYRLVSRTSNQSNA
ncbi:hypothetical protein CCP2SC5_1090002 [Azospirillaceae bacterium]